MCKLQIKYLKPTEFKIFNPYKTSTNTKNPTKIQAKRKILRIIYIYFAQIFITSKTPLFHRNSLYNK